MDQTIINQNIMMVVTGVMEVTTVLLQHKYNKGNIDYECIPIRNNINDTAS